ncbi:MAG: hypothetical protein H6603_05615 [Flavobacteriales bacterium]|nr:hypothetical protein [Flavobacteriales bacterium]
MKNHLKTSVLCTLLAIAISGCKQDVANAGWDVDIIAPVIHTQLNMADLLADSLLTSTSDGALRLKVQQPLIDLSLDSLLKIPDTTIVKPIVAGFAFNNIPPGFNLPSISDQSEFELGDIALKKVRVREGQLVLKVKSLVGTEVEFEYRIPKATLFGNMLIATGSVAPGAIGDTAVAEYEFNLANYDIDLRGFDGVSLNTLETSFVVNTAPDGDTVSIPIGTTFLTLEYTFSGLVPDYGLGYFGQESNQVENENSELDVLNRITDGQMFLDSVTIGLDITNGVGADAKFKLDQLSSINTRTSNTINLSHSIIGSNILLTRAQDINGTAEGVSPYTVNYELNNANSNIIDFIQNLPDQLGFTFGFELNPLGNVSAGNDFFYYDSPFQAIMDIDIPLRARLDNLTLVDTVDWNLSQTGVVESVNSGSFTLNAINGLPLEGMVEIIMLDENMVELGTLVAPSTIPAPALNAQNRVETPLESSIQIPISEQIADVLPATRKVHIRVRFNTAGQPNLVDFYDTYGIDLKLIGRFNINFGTSAL